MVFLNTRGRISFHLPGKIYFQLLIEKKIHYGITTANSFSRLQNTTACSFKRQDNRLLVDRSKQLSFVFLSKLFLCFFCGLISGCLPQKNGLKRKKWEIKKN
jgi:hypothetical protein